MFGFLKRLFGSVTPAAQNTVMQATVRQATEHVAPGTTIHYDPDLVDRLKRDHRRLEALFARLDQDCQRRDAVAVTEHVTQFSDVLRDHLLTENVRFYVYLQHEPEYAPVVQRFQHEIRVIGRTLTRFLVEYGQRRAWDEAAWDEFARELAALGPVLARRIATEEAELYPLYQPPRS